MAMTVFEALAAGVLDAPTAMKLIEKAEKHPGGRPPGSLNKGTCRRCGAKHGECECNNVCEKCGYVEVLVLPHDQAKINETSQGLMCCSVCGAEWAGYIVSDVEKTVEALASIREDMSDEEKADSELRVSLMLTNRWHWKRKKIREKLLLGQALTDDEGEVLVDLPGLKRAEVDLVVAHKRSESRVGMSRLKRVKGVAVKNGRGLGYQSEPEQIVEKSLQSPEADQWGVTVALENEVQEDLGYQAIPRRSDKGRRKLAPINLTQEFELGYRKVNGEWTKHTVVGAGNGSNGRSDLDGVKDAHGRVCVSCAAPATVAEHHQAILATDPVRGALPYEPDGRRRRPHYETHRAKLVLHGVRRNYYREITVGWYGDRKAVEIDACCILPDPVAPKSLTVRVDKYRASPTDWLAHLDIELSRKKGEVYRARPIVPESVSGAMGENQTGPYITRWRWDPTEAIDAIVEDVLAGAMSAKAGEKLAKQQEKWLKPDGSLIPEPAVVPLPAAKPSRSLFWDYGYGAFIPLSAVKRPAKCGPWYPPKVAREADGPSRDDLWWATREHRLDVRHGKCLPIVEPPAGYVEFLPSNSDYSEADRLHKRGVRIGRCLPIVSPPSGFVELLPCRKAVTKQVVREATFADLWSSDGEPLRGSVLWNARHRRQQPKPQVKYLPIVEPANGYVPFLAAERVESPVRPPATLANYA